jgi:hypothetical protein
MMWDSEKAVQHLNDHARVNSAGPCAEFVREAIEAGGLILVRKASAKDYGPSLESVMFWVLPEWPLHLAAGDVVVIQPVTGHPHGHMAMYNGSSWVSDFKQAHGYYPGPVYRAAKPPAVFYRHQLIYVSPPTALQGTKLA